MNPKFNMSIMITAVFIACAGHFFQRANGFPTVSSVTSVQDNNDENRNGDRIGSITRNLPSVQSPTQVTRIVGDRNPENDNTWQDLGSVSDVVSDETRYVNNVPTASSQYPNHTRHRATTPVVFNRPTWVSERMARIIARRRARQSRMREFIRAVLRGTERSDSIQFVTTSNDTNDSNAKRRMALRALRRRTNMN